LIAQDRRHLQQAQAEELIRQSDELGRVLSGLINSMKKLEEDSR